MKKLLLVLFLLTSIIYSSFAAVNVSYEATKSSEYNLKKLNNPFNGKAGILLGTFSIVMTSDANNVEMTIVSPHPDEIILTDSNGKKETFVMNGVWRYADGSLVNNKNIVKKNSINLSDNTDIKINLSKKQNVYFYFDIYLVSESKYDKLKSNYSVKNHDYLKSIAITQINCKEQNIVIDNVEQDSGTTISIPICNYQIQSNTIIPKEDAIDLPIVPLVLSSFTDMNDNTINESTYSLDYYAMHNAYYKAPVVKAKISIQNSDNSQNLNKFSQMYEVEISSNGAFTNSSGSTSISYDLITEIGSTNMSVVQGSKQHSYKLSSLETNDYAYFPIYFNFGSPDKLRNALAGVYTDNVKVVITPLE